MFFFNARIRGIIISWTRCAAVVGKKWSRRVGPERALDAQLAIEVVPRGTSGREEEVQEKRGGECLVAYENVGWTEDACEVDPSVDGGGGELIFEGEGGNGEFEDGSEVR